MSINEHLPSGWEKTTLGEVAEWGSGGTPSRNVPEYFGGSIPWIKTGELGDKYITNAEEFITEKAVEESSARIFPKGSVGIAMYGATIGKTSIWGIDAATNQACAVAQPKKQLLDSVFLYYFLLSQKQAFIDQGKGGAQRNISQSLLKKWPILLPPLNEQRRIVARIEDLFSELDAGVAALEQARAQLKRYRQALLKAAFEGKLTADWRRAHAGELEPAQALLARIRAEREARWRAQVRAWEADVRAWEAAGRPGKKPRKPRKPKELPPLTEEELAGLPELPEGWAWVRAGQLNAEVSDGPFGSNLKTSDYVDAGVRVIRLENIGRLQFDDSKRSYISEEKYELLKKHTVHGGDIIFASFIADELRVVVLPPFIEKAINKADCFLVRVFGSTMSNEYLAMYLSTRQVYSQLKHEVHGATRPRINTTQLKHVIIPICSPTERNKIVEILESQFSTIDYLDQTIEQALARAAALRQAILQRAFCGRLAPQDPEDEPAGELLA